MKKILALVLALVMCFVIVACDDKKDEGTTTTAGTTAAADSNPADSKPADTTAADTTGKTDAPVDTSVEGKYELKGIGEGDKIYNPADLGTAITMELKADGKATLTSAEESLEGSWELKGTSVTVTVDDEPASGEIKDGVITLTQDGAVMIFVKEGVTADIQYADISDIFGDESDLFTDASKLEGEYTLVAIGSNLEYYKAEDMGVAMTLKLEADGKGSMTVTGETDPITWEFDGLFIVTVTDEDGEAMEGTYMDGIISFVTEETTELVFAVEGADYESLIDFSEVPDEK